MSNTFTGQIIKSALENKIEDVRANIQASLSVKATKEIQKIEINNNE